MYRERRERLYCLDGGKAPMVLPVPGLLGEMTDCISRKSKTLVCLAHLCIGSCLIVYGCKLTGISQIIAMVLGCVMAVPFVEKLVWLVINAFFRES